MIDRIIIVGDSHVSNYVVLIRSNVGKSNPKTDDEIRFEAHYVYPARIDSRLTVVGNGRPAINDVILAPLAKIGLTNLVDGTEVIKLPSNIGLVFSFGGQIPFRFVGDKNWLGIDFSSPELPDAPLDSTLDMIPYSIVLETMRERMGSVKQFIGLLSRMLGRDFRFLLGPPPNRDSRVILERAQKNSSYFAKLEQSDLQTDFVRLKFYALYRKVMADICAEFGVDLILPNESVTDELGFLLPRFDQDGFHTNTEYAAIMLQDIQDRFRMP